MRVRSIGLLMQNHHRARSRSKGGDLDAVYVEALICVLP
jgi:hypothetical protein